MHCKSLRNAIAWCSLLETASRPGGRGRSLERVGGSGGVVIACFDRGHGDGVRRPIALVLSFADNLVLDSHRGGGLIEN